MGLAACWNQSCDLRRRVSFGPLVLRVEGSPSSLSMAITFSPLIVDLDRDATNRRKLRRETIARLEWELPDERTRHDELAGLERASKFPQLVVYPQHRIDRVTEDCRARTASHFLVVDEERGGFLIKRNVRRNFDRRAQDDRGVLGIVSKGNAQVVHGASFFNELQRRIAIVHSPTNLFRRLRGFDSAGNPAADFGFDVRFDIARGGQYVARLVNRLLPNRAEKRLRHSELLLQDLVYSRYLPARARVFDATQSVRKLELDIVPLFHGQTTRPLDRKRIVSLRPVPKILDCLMLECH